MADSNFNIPGEIWKAISDYPGYEVSSFGRVRSYWKWKPTKGMKRVTYIFYKPTKVMKPCISGKNLGYLQVNLCKNGQRFPKNIHCLVLEAFICPRPDGLECCHIDGNGKNNHINNLRWGTKSSNHQDRIAHGTYQYGEKNPAAKLTWEVISKIRYLFNNGMRQCDIARLLHLTPVHIHEIVRNKAWTKHL